jgi:hypothetical protein
MVMIVTEKKKRAAPVSLCFHAELSAQPSLKRTSISHSALGPLSWLSLRKAFGLLSSEQNILFVILAQRGN